MTNCGALASIDADREGLRDGMREVKVETFVAASSLQFDAIYERAISTLGTSFEARYHKYLVTGIWHLLQAHVPALFSLAVLGVILATHR